MTRHSSTKQDELNGLSNIQLSDISSLNDDEKQHILKVLCRDEELRSQHLTRFMQLRKEIDELESIEQTDSTKQCARCQTPFGFIFNKGDCCPKCGAKVCNQCRLIYNGNQSGWLCQLCCKQIQLFSFSGEWINLLGSNVRKNSVAASEELRKSLTPSSTQKFHSEPSFEEEPEGSQPDVYKKVVDDNPDQGRQKSISSVENTADPNVVPLSYPESM
ncbi:unnamed protein product [Didymodactylos carnosus]|uniref:RabBD domain-containing protein n=1 Tax=Didymodactylos carnosus TaxID=1234261 RepID=A0A814B659_9BILA|nr:unnamed protein product [Didymodactylos carnosus]CAF0923297.1 unnamed protein product [Didymodactylos carnosus]CAF3592143.1 unnamed protein product [Didymodactylos carnosus]CAF3702308.1 unnamed protein product [Didymodactylos carnosus]